MEKKDPASPESVHVEDYFPDPALNDLSIELILNNNGDIGPLSNEFINEEEQLDLANDDDEEAETEGYASGLDNLIDPDLFLLNSPYQSPDKDAIADDVAVVADVVDNGQENVNFPLNFDLNEAPILEIDLNELAGLDNIGQEIDLNELAALDNIGQEIDLNELAALDNIGQEIDLNELAALDNIGQGILNGDQNDAVEDNAVEFNLNVIPLDLNALPFDLNEVPSP